MSYLPGEGINSKALINLTSGPIRKQKLRHWVAKFAPRTGRKPKEIQRLGIWAHRIFRT